MHLRRERCNTLPRQKLSNDLVLPTIKYPKKKENEMLRLIRLQREYEAKYGDSLNTVGVLDMKPAPLS